MKAPERLKGIIFALVLLPAFAAVARGFGRNKVIIRDFDWKVTSTEHFDIHYYEDSRPWVNHTAKVLERAYEDVTGDFKRPLEEKRSFFLYATANDMQQSNIVDVGDGVGGVSEMFKDRFMVYADGSRAWLENVLPHEFTHIVQFDVLLEGFWKSARILKTLIYPLWMLEGMAEYETGDKDIAVENLYVRDAATSKGLISLVHLHQFSHLKPHQMTLAYKESASAIRFLALEYGGDKVGKMLKSFRTRYDISSVLQSLIGLDLFAFDRKFREYLELKYARQVRVEALKEPERYGQRLTSEKGNIPEFNASPSLSRDGSKMAYLSTRQGHPPVIYVMDMKTGREKKWDALSMGAENIPMGRFTKMEKNLSLSQDGRWLALSGQKNHREYLYLVDVKNGKVRKLKIPQMMAVRHPRFSPDGGKIAFAGMKNGFTDIYTLSMNPDVVRGKVACKDVTRITMDDADDSSPSFSPDGKNIVYSCEVFTSSGAQRDICIVPHTPLPAPDSRGRQKLVELPGDERDPVFSPDGKRVMFVGDGQGIFELYEKDLSSGKVTRLTRTIGGNFTPVYSPDGTEIYFASFRRGSIHIFKGQYETFLHEEIPGTVRKEEKAAKLSQPKLSAARPYRFGASTDLFFPAFFYSSQGGFFWTNYWQGSDNLGNHRGNMILSYSSGDKYLNYQTGYAYLRFRPQFFIQADGYISHDSINSLDLMCKEDRHRQILGIAYPFDRYHRMEISALNKTELTDYSDIDVRYSDQTRAGQIAFIRDTINGRYLVATRGSRLMVSSLEAFRALGGNQKYTTHALEAHQYIPIGTQSAFALRALGAVSFGPDRRTFKLGGIDRVRGFLRSSQVNAATRFVLGTAELRFPVIRDIDYYMWYLFPDFYFKTIFASIFTDAALGWDTAGQLKNSGIGDVKNSVGFGIQIHTFVLQMFPLVLTFDYAFKTNNGGRVLYFYLGPVF